jgi:hypothetical protein
MRKKYISDISRKTFEKIEPVLLKGRKRTRPRKVDVYEVFCALLYLLKEWLPMGHVAEGFSSEEYGVLLL